MHLRRGLPLSAALLASAAVALPAAVPASAEPLTLFALEIFEPEGGEVPAPLCGNTTRGVQDPPPPELPRGTIPVAVVQGSLPQRVPDLQQGQQRPCRFRVDIGTDRVLVYRSAETRVSNPQLLNTAPRGVRVVAARDEQTGVLVAEKVVGRQTARNEIEQAFLATVTVKERGGAWLTTEIGGTREFLFDVAAAEIEAPADTAAEVAIEFDTVAPEPD